MRGTTKLLQAVCAVALLAGATPAFAQDDTTSALLLRLKEKGILTQAEYDDLVARKAPVAQPAAVATTPRAEYTHTKAEAQGPNAARSNTVSVGSILFF